MTKRKTDEAKLRLPEPIPEDGYPAGDGPAWISEAVGAPGCLDGVSRYLTDNGEETAVVLHFGNGQQQVFRPARLVTTRRLAEVLGACGFPVPYYSPPQLALIGQAIGRVADRQLAHEQERSYLDTCSLVASWLLDCLRRDQSVKSDQCFVLLDRMGENVRAAIEHVRFTPPGSNHASAVERLRSDDLRVPLIVEPERKILLAWTVPVAAMIRKRQGTTHDADIGLALKRGGLKRERLAARRAPTEQTRTPHEMPVWVVYNGWQGVEVEMPADCSENGPVKLCPL